MNKKGQEFRFIVFIVVFLSIMGIISTIFVTDLLKSTYKDTWVEKILSTSGITPLIPFNSLFATSFTFISMHPYLATVLTALFGIPISYLILRLVRGGG